MKEKFQFKDNKKDPLEKDIERKVREYAKGKGVLNHKFVSPSNRGVVDRLFIFKGGTVAFMELKRKGKKPSPLQQKFIDAVVDQGGHAVYCDSFDSAKAYLDAMIFLCS